jgi:hypothetical protein
MKIYDSYAHVYSLYALIYIMKAQKRYADAVGKCMEALDIVNKSNHDLYLEKAIILYNLGRYIEYIHVCMYVYILCIVCVYPINARSLAFV